MSCPHCGCKTSRILAKDYSWYRWECDACKALGTLFASSRMAQGEWDAGTLHLTPPVFAKENRGRRMVSCKVCIYHDEDEGICRFNPPQVTFYTETSRENGCRCEFIESRWPVVGKDDCCGQGRVE